MANIVGPWKCISAKDEIKENIYDPNKIVMEIRRIMKNKEIDELWFLGDKNLTESDYIIRNGSLGEIYIDIADYNSALLIKGKITKLRLFSFVIDITIPEKLEVKCSFKIIGKHMYLKFKGIENTFTTIFERYDTHFF